MLGAADTSDVDDFLERVAFTSARVSKERHGKAEDKWVRYGAVRSLIEGLTRLAGADLERRNGKLREIAARVGDLDEVNVIQELRRLRFIGPDETGWASAYEVVYNACRAAESALIDRPKGGS
jgi:hypothetical protein